MSLSKREERYGKRIWQNIESQTENKELEDDQTGRNNIVDIMTTTDFKVGNTVKVKEGIVCPDMQDLIIGGWQGIISEITKSDNGNLLIYIEWDSITLENMPEAFIDDSGENGLGFSSMSLLDNEIELAITIIWSSVSDFKAWCCSVWYGNVMWSFVR